METDARSPAILSPHTFIQDVLSVPDLLEEIFKKLPTKDILNAVGVYSFETQILYSYGC